jgi:hypothetical protein
MCGPQRNPLGTCLIVPDFLVESTGDRILHPTGALAAHLLAMANPEPPNTSIDICHYLCTRAGSDDMFPKSYSSHQGHGSSALEMEILDYAQHPQAHVFHNVPATTGQRDASNSTTSSAIIATTTASNSSSNGSGCRDHTSSSTASASSSQEEEEADRAMDVVMSCIELALQTHRQGTRALLVVNPSSERVFVVDGDLAVTILQPSSPQDEQTLHAWLSEQPGSTILDGDVVVSTSVEFVRHKEFVWSDAIMLNGNVLENGMGHSASEGHQSDSSRPLVSAWLMFSNLDDISFVDGWSIRT